MALDLKFKVHLKVLCTNTHKAECLSACLFVCLLPISSALLQVPFTTASAQRLLASECFFIHI